MFDHDAEPAAIFRRQEGVITNRQARRAGLTRAQIRARVASGAWIRAHCGIYRHALVPHGWLADLWVGLLATGGVASHRSAAHLHRFEKAGEPRAEVVVEHGRWRPVSGVIVHQSTQIDRIDLTIIDGIPCTGRARTVLDLGASMGPRQLGGVVDAQLRRQLITQAELWDVLVRHSRQGRDGCGPLRIVLDARLGQDRIALSDWSYAVANLLESAGLGRPELEFRAHDDHGRFLAQIDLAYPEAMLAIELDSVAHHADLEAFGRDRARSRQLTVSGWTVLPFTWEDTTKRPEQLIAQVSAILRREAAA